MKTRILQPTKTNIELCARRLRAGGVVAFPTETVYGLGANAFMPDAVRKIYEVKGRPSDNPLIVHIYEQSQIFELAAFVPPVAETLAKAFMPGALTLVLKKKSVVPDAVTGTLDTVAVRMPSHPVAAALLAACKVPVCAPSANTSTKPSPTLAKHVLADLDGRIEYILDGGACDIGVESTIVDVSGERPRLLRQGGIPAEAFEPYCGKMEIVRSSGVALCPGMKYKHYSPKAEVFLSAYYSHMADGICKKYDELIALGKNPVILCLDGNAQSYGERSSICVGADYSAYAHNLFALLRQCDDERYDSIIAEGVSGAGLGAAIINRLVKASGGQII